MKFLDNKKWQKELSTSFDKNTDASDFCEKVNRKLLNVRDWERHRVAQEALCFALQHHREDLAKLSVESLYDKKSDIDIGMLNYLVSKMDSQSLRLYASIVPMTEADRKAEDYDSFIYWMASQGRIDDVLFCEKQGFELSGDFLFRSAVSANNFDDADAYFERYDVDFTPEEWDTWLSSLAYHCHEKDRDSIESMRYLEKKIPSHPIIGYTPMVMAKACSNGGTHVAEFLHAKGANLHQPDKEADPLFVARANTKMVRWLLEKNVNCRRHGASVVPILFNKENSEDLVFSILNKMKPADIPWSELMANAASADPKNCISKIDYLRSLHAYSEHEMHDAYARNIAFDMPKWAHVRKHLEACGVKPTFDLAKRISSMPNIYANSNSLKTLIVENKIDVSQDDSILLWDEVDRIVSRGGKIDFFKTLLSLGATPMAQGDKILDRVNQSRRKDLREAIDPFLPEEKQIRSDDLEKFF